VLGILNGLLTATALVWLLRKPKHFQGTHSYLPGYSSCTCWPAKGRVERHKTFCLFGITFSGIAGQHGISENRPTAFHDIVDRATCDQFFRRLALLYPIFQCRHGVKLGEPGAPAVG
jgi:hypothetical protein